VSWNGRRIAGTPVTVDVVPATGRPRPSRPNNPFLMPGGPGFGFQFPGFQLPNVQPQEDPDTGPRLEPALALPAAPDPSVFIRVVPDKKSVVVGQQVSLSLYVYFNVARVEPVGTHDAPIPDFLRYPTLDSGTEKAVTAMVGGTRFTVKRTEQLALFPLHAGDLHTGRWRWEFRLGRSRQAVERASEDLVIHVTEPPRAGRPVGYALGDVGQLSLSASVDPRTVPQGGEVAVRLQLSGTGNLPEKLRIPERTGLEWLDPEKKESIEPQGGVIGGWRSFGYVVRVKDSGTIDLGEVTLPYWDPVADRYKVARAVLGKIQVTPTVPAVDPTTKELVDQPAPDPFLSLPAARASLGPWAPPAARRLEGPRMWWIIAAPPLLVGAVSAGAGTLRRARARRAIAREDPATLSRSALAEAHRAEGAGDGKALAAALERAIHLAVEGATGLKSRGVLVADLPAELADRGLPAALSEAVSGALSACETVRFDPATDAATARDLSARVRAVVSDLGRHRSTPGAASA
jgi:hypothetical protein